jgi:hypothetical protein
MVWIGASSEPAAATILPVAIAERHFPPRSLDSHSKNGAWLEKFRTIYHKKSENSLLLAGSEKIFYQSKLLV